MGRRKHHDPDERACEVPPDPEETEDEPAVLEPELLESDPLVPVPVDSLVDAGVVDSDVVVPDVLDVDDASGVEAHNATLVAPAAMRLAALTATVTRAALRLPASLRFTYRLPIRSSCSR